MEELNDNNQTPPRFRGKWKIATLTLLFLVIFFSFGYAGLEGSSKSEFCASCHEMNPEYYTWKNSAHSEVDCVACHTEPGVENIAKGKVDTIEQAIKKQMQTYEAPIRMPSEISDASCEKCHNVYNRNFTVSGDLIIPHDKHKEQDISCTQCHSGIAHGKIADRKMTYKPITSNGMTRLERISCLTRSLSNLIWIRASIVIKLERLLLSVAPAIQQE